MKNILGWLCLLLSLGSCYRSAPDPSFNMTLVIPADSMVTLLTDLHTADGIVSTLKDKKKPVEQLSTEYFEAILKKHAIGRDVFEESMRYYAFHAEKLNEIYEQVIINLSKQESWFQPQQEIKAPVP